MEYNLKPDEKATLQLRGLYEEYGYQKFSVRQQPGLPSRR